MTSVGVPPYPNDAPIRKFASFFGRRDVLDMLRKIGVDLLGNADRVYGLAEEFAGNKTIDQARDGVQDAVQAVAGTWDGRAYEQFDTYAERVSDTLKDNQEVVRRNIAGILAGSARIVVDAYQSAIIFVGECAAALAGLGPKIALAIGTAPIPVLDLFTMTDAIGAIGDAFEKFLNAATGLIERTVGQLADFVSQAIALRGEAAAFRELPELSGRSGIDDHRQWKIEPSAYPES